MGKIDKITRILILYNRLIKGENINKTSFALENGINERSVDRDIEDIRMFLSEIYSTHELLFDRVSGMYYMTGCNNAEVTGVELMALLKILISSRAFTKDEMEGLLSGIVSLVSNYKGKELIEVVRNEVDNYKQPSHGKAILKLQWDLNKCILNQRKIKMEYYKQNSEKVERIVSPISVVFSEYYFYLVAFIDGHDYNYPAFFRIDRINSFKVLEEMYPKELFNQYNVGDMRKSIQFMYAGDLIDIKLKCNKNLIEPVLDKLPNGEIAETFQDYYIVKAKIFGQEFMKWILSQGNQIEVLEPKELRKSIYESIINMAKLYKDEGSEDNG